MKIRGELENSGLLNLIMLIKTLGKTGFLEINRGEEDSAILYFDEGELINATYNDIKGEEVINILINWNTGSYAFTDHLLSVDKNIKTNGIGAYKEGMRKYFVYTILNKINVKLGGKSERSDTDN